MMKFKIIVISAAAIAALFVFAAFTGLRVVTLAPQGNLQRTVIAAAPFSYRLFDDVYSMCARKELYSELGKLSDVACADQLTQTIYTSSFVLTVSEAELRQF